MTVSELEFFFDTSHHLLMKKVKEFATKKLEPCPLEEGDEEERARKLIKLMADENLLRYTVPQRYGGAYPGLDIRSLCLIREGLAFSSSLADTLFAMQGLGSYPITLAGSEDVKSKCLPSVASGEAVATFALTEPEAGSDAASIRTLASKEGEFYVLNGVKTLISNAGLADVYTVFAKTDPDKGQKGISAFVVTKDAVGFDLVKKFELLAPHPIGEVAFNNCRIPAVNLLGQEGDGFKIALATLENFRITVGAAALGMGERALHEAISYARERVQFGKRLSEFQLIKSKLAWMATELDAAKLLVYRAAWKKDKGEKRMPVESAMAKLYATEIAQKAVDEALQIHGGIGVVKGTVVERLYREIRALRIYEGTSEIQQLIIADSLLKR